MSDDQIEGSFRRRESQSFPNFVSTYLNLLVTVGIVGLTVVAANNAPRRPEKERTGQSEIAKTLPSREEVVLKRLQERIGSLTDKKSPAPVLDKRTSLKQACRFTSDWFKQEAGNLDTVWNYLVAHRTRWPQDIPDSFAELGNVLKGVPRPLRWFFNVPTTGKEVEDTMGARIADPKEFSCGLALSKLATKTDVAQKIGIRLIEAVTAFTLKDMQDDTLPDEQKKQALQASEALAKALANPILKGKK